MFLEKGRSFSGAFELRNPSRGKVVAATVELAVTSAARRRGLLGRQGLASGHAILIAPCWSIHTWFMQFAIDVIFVTRDGRVVKTLAAVPPWRMTAAWRAYATVEMASGEIQRLGIAERDRLELVQSPG